MDAMDQSMTARMRLKETVPDAYRALARLERHVRESVCPRLLQLVNLRASIVNGCACCVDLHSREALAAGDSAERLFAVAVWRESASCVQRVAVDARLAGQGSLVRSVCPGKAFQGVCCRRRS